MKFKFLLATIAVVLAGASVNAQGLAGKLKQKAAEAAERALDKGSKEKKKNGNDDNSDSSSPGNNGGSNRQSNKGGGGLVSTPPDVNQNLADAESAYKSGSYGDARYAVQQAMLGVELEIGQKVLKSLPESVNNLPKDEKQDQVTSTGWGWAGLTIKREYTSDEKQLITTVANNAAWMSSVNAYLANGGYAQQTNGEQNWKQTKVKGYRAVIEYDENSGYKLSVPLGQTSLIVWEAVNFESEKEVMDAANAFDIDGIKNMLGEK